MKQDEIIEMARQATLDEMWELSPRFVARLEAFAKLVADVATAKEREACIAIAESKRHAPNFALTSMPLQDVTAVDISNAIRARVDS